MLYNYFTEKLIVLKGVIIKNAEIKGNLTVIYAEMERKEQYCTCCGAATSTVHLKLCCPHILLHLVFASLFYN